MSRLKLPMLPIMDQLVLASILAPTLQILLLLLTIYTGFTASIALAMILSGSIPAADLAWYVLARDLIALEVILPTASFLGTVIGISQLHRDREAYAFYVAGISPARLGRAVLFFALLVFLAAAALSNYGRSWAYQQSDTIFLSRDSFSVVDLQPRTFHRVDGGMVIYARRVNRTNSSLEDVLITRSEAQQTTVVRASSAREISTGEGQRRLQLDNGIEYKISEIDAADRTTHFSRFSYTLPPTTEETISMRRKAQPSAELSLSTQAKDIAELQWRQVLPLVALLLPFIGLRLGRVAAGTAGYASLWKALLIYLLVYSAASVLRSAVENAQLTAMPGMYLLPVIIGLIIVAAIVTGSIRTGSSHG